MTLLFHDIDDKGKKRRDRANYRRLMSGIAFNEAKTLVGNWNQVLSLPMTSFEFTLPCMFPLSFGHTITPINPIEIDSPESTNIHVSFKKSGIVEDATILPLREPSLSHLDLRSPERSHFMHSFTNLLSPLR